LLSFCTFINSQQAESYKTPETHLMLETHTFFTMTQLPSLWEKAWLHGTPSNGIKWKQNHKKDWGDS